MSGISSHTYRGWLIALEAIASPLLRCHQGFRIFVKVVSRIIAAVPDGDGMPQYCYYGPEILIWRPFFKQNILGSRKIQLDELSLSSMRVLRNSPKLFN